MLIPAGHRVLVKPDDIEETDEVFKAAKSAGLQIVHENEKVVKASQTYGTLVAIGKNAWKSFDDGEAWAEVGDRVSYSRYGGYFVEDPSTGERLVLMNDDDITCIVLEDIEDA